ncbi:hypothetical protein L63ED372_01088 [Limnohabitans sp. 63ED37-2]|nr:hypothetical protein L63ED372_01088 [Limnohabitans sp. 63ED37-2]
MHLHGFPPVTGSAKQIVPSTWGSSVPPQAFCLVAQASISYLVNIVTATLATGFGSRSNARVLLYKQLRYSQSSASSSWGFIALKLSSPLVTSRAKQPLLQAVPRLSLWLAIVFSSTGGPSTRMFMSYFQILKPANPSFNRTCFGVAEPGIISFLPGSATLAHAG